MTFTKIDPADLDSPRRELSNGGLKSVQTLLVRWQIIFLSARIGRPIQLYSRRDKNKNKLPLVSGFQPVIICH